MSSSIPSLRAAAAAGGCRQFASSAVLGLMLSSNKMYSLCEKKVVNITNNIEKESEWDTVVGSSHGWVGLFKRNYEKSGEQTAGISSSSVSVWNPISGDHIMLPPIVGILSTDTIEKMIVDDAECSRVVIVGSSDWLGVCCPGRCRDWLLFHPQRENQDVVSCSQRKFYTIERTSDELERWNTSNSDELVRWNVSEPRRPRMEWMSSLSELGYDDKLPRKPNRYSSPPHLVYAEQSDQLFLVTRRHHCIESKDRYGSGIWEHEDLQWHIYPCMTDGFDVYLVEQLSSGKGQLRYMKHSLDGLVMFVGLNDSFAVPAADFPHLKPDSVYFTDHHHQTQYTIHLQQWVGHDVGVYDYKNEVVSSCYFPVDQHCFKRTDDPPPFWFTPTSTK